MIGWVQAHQRLSLVLSFVLLAMFSLLVLRWEGVLRRITTLRAEHLAEVALRRLQAGDLAEALEKSGAAGQLAPGNSKVVRAKAHVLSAAGHPSTPEVWIQVAKFDPDDESLAEGAKAAISLGELSLASSFIDQLESLDPQHPVIHELRAGLSLAQGEVVGAVEALARLDATAQLGDATAITLSTLLRQVGEVAPELLERDFERLRAIAATGSDHAPIALALMAVQMPVDHPQRESILDRLAKHPASDVTHRLAAHRLRFLDREDWVAPVKDKVIEDSEAWTVAERVAAVEWLVDQSNRSSLELAMTLMPSRHTNESRALMGLKLKVAETLGDFREVKEELSAPLPTLMEAERLAFLAVITAREGAEEEGKLIWRDAVVAARSEPQAILMLANRAESLGWLEEAETLYERLSNEATTMASAYDGLVRIAEQRNGLAATLPVLDRAVLAQPRSLRAKTNQLYVRFLLKKHSQEDIQTAAGIALQFQDSPACRATLALGFLRAADPANALNVILDPPIDWGAGEASQGVVAAAVFAANGKASEARELIRRIGTERLRKEELALISEELIPKESKQPAP